MKSLCSLRTGAGTKTESNSGDFVLSSLFVDVYTNNFTVDFHATCCVMTVMIALLNSLKMNCDNVSISRVPLKNWIVDLTHTNKIK